MKIVVLGDVHGDLEVAKEIIEDKSPDYILCTGDLETYTDFEVPFFFVYGNHEDFDEIEEMRESGTYRNLNLICPGDVVSCQLPPAKAGGLWFDSTVCRSRSRFDAVHVWLADIGWLALSARYGWGTAQRHTVQVCKPIHRLSLVG